MITDNIWLLPLYIISYMITDKSLISAFVGMYEHFSRMGMGISDIPRIRSSSLGRLIISLDRCHTCTVDRVCVQIDGFTHVRVLWSPYDDYHHRSLEVIDMFLGYI